MKRYKVTFYCEDMDYCWDLYVNAYGIIPAIQRAIDIMFSNKKFNAGHYYEPIECVLCEGSK